MCACVCVCVILTSCEVLGIVSIDRESTVFGVQGALRRSDPFIDQCCRPSELPVSSCKCEHVCVNGVKMVCMHISLLTRSNYTYNTVSMCMQQWQCSLVRLPRYSIAHVAPVHRWSQL